MKKRLPSVSIILVTYNAENFIEKTLNSCLNQTYKNKEVLVLDNYSLDKTREILKIYQKKNKRLKVFFSKKNLGAYPGLNFLINTSKGDLIAIQDHDDIWLPEKISLQVDFLLKNPEFIGVGTNSYTYFENDKLFLKKDRSGIVDCVVHTSLLFKKKKGINYKLDEVLTDEYFQKRILTKIGKLYCLPEFLNIRRIRADQKNLSSSRFKFNKENLQSFFRTEGLNPLSLIYLLEIALLGYLPKKLPWVVREYRKLSGGEWINYEDMSLILKRLV